MTLVFAPTPRFVFSQVIRLPKTTTTEPRNQFKAWAPPNRSPVPPREMTDTKNDSVAGASAVTAPHEAPPTMAEYKKSQARVRELVEKRRILDRRLVR